MNNKLKEKINIDLKNGYIHEKKCVKLFQKNGYEIFKGSKYHDTIEHWDYLVKKNGKKARVEIKGLKDAHLFGYTWLEIVNVKGEKGWLYGMADVLSIETKDCFNIYLMKGLRELVEKMVDETKPTLISKPMLDEKNVDYEYMRFRIYNRRGDKMTVVSFNDIEKHMIFSMKKEEK